MRVKSISMLIFIISIFVLCSSCRNTLYIEKQSENVSRTVYATKDSLDNARIDLASQYINETTKLIIPPKQRIPIEAIYVKNSTSKGTKIQKDNKRMIVVPAEYANEEVLVVGSSEYKELLSTKEIANQLAQDKENLEKEKENTNTELRNKEKQITDMISSISNLQVEVANKTATIYKLGCALIGLIVLIGLYVYLKVKALLPSYLIF